MNFGETTQTPKKKNNYRFQRLLAAPCRGKMPFQVVVAVSRGTNKSEIYFPAGIENLGLPEIAHRHALEDLSFVSFFSMRPINSAADLPFSLRTE